MGKSNNNMEVSSVLKDAELEEAVLKNLMGRYEDIDEAMQRLTDDCFTSVNNQLMFRAIRQVYDRGEKVEIPTVFMALMNLTSQDMQQHLKDQFLSLSTQLPDQASLATMVTYLLDLSRKRRIEPIAWKLQQLAHSAGMNLTEVVAEVIEELNAVTTDTTCQTFSTLEEELQVALQHIEDNSHEETRHQGIRTSIPLFDESGGLPPGLVVVAAKSSHGKTSFANFLALNAMRSGSKVVYYSMEMTNLQLTQRLLAMETGINANVLAHHKLNCWEKDQVQAGAQRLVEGHAESFRFDRRGINRLDQMLQSIRALKRREGVDLVVVDYIQLLGIDTQVRDESTAKRIGHAAHVMHDIGISLGVTILCLSQLNRNAMGLPCRAQIRDSGEIDEAADMTILLYRAEADKLGAYPPPFEEVETKGTALVLLDKSRNGATGHAVMGFEPQTTSFRVLEAVKKRELQCEVEWEV